MKLKFSHITIGFTLAGLLFAVLSVITSLAYWVASPAFEPALRQTAYFLVYLCPASFGEMAFDNAAPSEYWILFAIELISNTVLYFLLGLLFSWAWRWLSRLEIK